MSHHGSAFFQNGFVTKTGTFVWNQDIQGRVNSRRLNHPFEGKVQFVRKEWVENLRGIVTQYCEISPTLKAEC